jgi:hypothetical protein
MRTDIPAFYSKWFARRIKEGFVIVRNPYNESQCTRYSLSPDVVDLIAFCTKNPSPMFSYFDLLKPYGQYWFVTITPYGREIEPNVPDKERVMDDFIRLSEQVGVNSVGWRYDPVFITKKYSLESHIESFEKMAEKLSGHTEICVISFIDLYGKVRRNFPEARAVSPDERMRIGENFVKIGSKYGIKIKSCAEGYDLQPVGVDCDGCLTQSTYEKALGTSLKMPRRKSPRKECACFLGNDIGSYDTCGHLCRYCYANTDPSAVRKNMKAHDPDSPLLLGDLSAGDVVHDAKQERWADMQLHF